jgi:thioredoxin reductase
LARAGIPVRQARILRFEGRDGVLERVVFAGGDALARRGVFFSTGQRQHSALASSLGCEFTHKGAVKTNRQEGTGIPGLWVAGDASHDVQMAIVAAAEGAKAGVAINTDLQREDGLR